MKKLKLALTGTAILVAGGIWINHAQRTEQALDAEARRLSPESYYSPQELREQAAEQAESVMLEACSNHVGFLRIVDKLCQASPLDDVTNWRGNCTFDYVNKLGGVERTNLMFIFYAKGNIVVAQEDPEMLGRELDRIFKSAPGQ